VAQSLPSTQFALLNTMQPCDVQVTDANGNPVDAAVISLKIMDMGGNIVATDNYYNPPAGGTLIVKPPGTVGYYYYRFGDINITTPLSLTQSPGAYIIQWYIQAQNAYVPNIVLQNVTVYGFMAAQNVPYLRLYIDKARKLVDPANNVFLGYTDAQILMYMQEGISMVNAFQPETQMAFDINSFPYFAYRHVVNEAAMVAAIMSQQMFAIDTDLPNYSDQGITFVISHQPQLAAFLNTLTARLDKEIQAMKLQWVSTGSIHMVQGPNYRLATIMSAAPLGSLFRNVFFVG
jgi:hypothetical protein